MNKIDLSIILPVYNEEENLKEQHQQITEALAGLAINYETIFINDGSSDGSTKVLEEIARDNRNIKVIQFARNFGQTAAMSAGFDHAQGEVIIPMDADLQYEPKDIPKFLEKIEQGYDVVAGWRKRRGDKFLTKILPSKTANKIISKITKVSLHDYGCTMKAFKKDTIKKVSLYGEMHRLIPAYTAWLGAKVTEIETQHHPRKAGKTKYNLSKAFRVILDILAVKFLTAYLSRPIHFFGGVGFLSFLGGIAAAGTAVYLKFAAGLHLTRSPLLLFAAFLGITGIVFILMGLLAEIMTRIYYETRDKKYYIIKNKINFNE